MLIRCASRFCHCALAPFMTGGISMPINLRFSIPIIPPSIVSNSSIRAVGMDRLCAFFGHFNQRFNLYHFYIVLELGFMAAGFGATTSASRSSRTTRIFLIVLYNRSTSAGARYVTKILLKSDIIIFYNLFVTFS